MNELRRIANIRRNLPSVTAEAMTAARAAGHTWREISIALEMTEKGVRELAARDKANRLTD